MQQYIEYVTSLRLEQQARFADGQEQVTNRSSLGRDSQAHTGTTARRHSSASRRCRHSDS